MERETEIRYSSRMVHRTNTTPEELAKRWEQIMGKKMVGKLNEDGSVQIKQDKQKDKPA